MVWFVRVTYSNGTLRIGLASIRSPWLWSTSRLQHCLNFEWISVLPSYIDECRHTGMELFLSSQGFFVVPLASWCLCYVWHTYAILARVVVQTLVPRRAIFEELLYLQWDQCGLLSPLHLHCLFLHLINGLSAIRFGYYSITLCEHRQRRSFFVCTGNFWNCFSRGAFNINKWTFRHTLGAAVRGFHPQVALIGHSVFGEYQGTCLN